MPTSPLLRAHDLPQRLRAETADLHRAVEASTGLPASVRTLDDYVRVLIRFLGFHRQAMIALRDPRWAEQWAPLGIELDRHDRTPHLRSDLDRLGKTAPDDETVPLDIDSFGAALGCLYVVEGSALGGRMLATAVRETLGEVPLSFFAGDGRAHPLPWRTTQAALRIYEATDGDDDLVLAGAVATFSAFERIVATPDGAVA